MSENVIKISDPLFPKNIEVFIVSYENDGDFPECEIVLGTLSYKDAIGKAKTRPNTYAYSEITIFSNNKIVRSEQYGSDSIFPDTGKM